jgi:hypothetical protein
LGGGAILGELFSPIAGEEWMATASSQEVTRLLRAWSWGDEIAIEALIPLIYRELRQRVHRYMGHERPGHTL